MGHTYQLAYWSHLCTGFEGIDLEDYEVCQLLGPYVAPPMRAIEAFDLVVRRVELKELTIWFYPDHEGIPEANRWPADAAVKHIPVGFIDRLRELSKSPRVPWPVPVPPDDVQARLDRVDELLFVEDTKPGRVFMNAVSYADVRKWHRVRQDIINDAARLKMGWVSTLYRPDFDPETAEKEDFNAGWQIWVSRFVPPGFLYIDTEGGYGPLKADCVLETLHVLEVESSP